MNVHGSKGGEIECLGKYSPQDYTLCQHQDVSLDKRKTVMTQIMCAAHFNSKNINVTCTASITSYFTMSVLLPASRGIVNWQVWPLCTS